MQISWGTSAQEAALHPLLCKPSRQANVFTVCLPTCSKAKVQKRLRELPVQPIVTAVGSGYGSFHPQGRGKIIEGAHWQAGGRESGGTAVLF